MGHDTGVPGDSELVTSLYIGQKHCQLCPCILQTSVCLQVLSGDQPRIQQRGIVLGQQADATPQRLPDAHNQQPLTAASEVVDMDGE